jgi:pimeloyl-ACP methyl ester carboxylesterase
MPKVVLNGVRLHYQRRLSGGPQVVLLHGLAANLAFWYFRIAPLLVRDFSLTMYDLRGHGQSDISPSGYTTADMALDLHGLLDHLEVSRAHLVGHSYGGAVALHYAVLHPERVASLTLADARIRAFQPTQRLSDWPNAKVWRRKLKQLAIPVPVDHPEMGHQFLEALAEAKVKGIEVKNSTLGLYSPFGLSENSRRSAERWLQLLKSTTLRNDFMAVAGLTIEKICRVNKPVLAIYGEFSNCLPSYSALKQHLPNCRVVMVPRASHFHPFARPVFFGRNVRKFLKEVGDGSVDTPLG